MSEQATIKYVGLPVDDIRPGMPIPAIFLPNDSYVDTTAYVDGHPDDYGKSIYATNVNGWGGLPGLLPMASTPTKFAWFEMAVIESTKAQLAGEEIPTITVDIENQQDKLWWLQMAPNFVGSGFYITVGDKVFGEDPAAEDEPAEPSEP